MLLRVELELAIHLTSGCPQRREEFPNSRVITMQKGNVIAVVDEGDGLLDDKIEQGRALRWSGLRR